MQRIDTAVPAARGRRLDASEDAFGWLRTSDELIGDRAALRARLSEDGYLFLPAALDREPVRAARLELLGAAAGTARSTRPIRLEDGVLLPGRRRPRAVAGLPSSSAVLAVDAPRPAR